jgi:LmbE family N-acetylglucosaminyl deacetylase
MRKFMVTGNKWLKCIITFFSVFLFLALFLFAYSGHYSYGTNFRNSYSSQLKSAIKTAMVIVPHEDDEINVAGTMIKTLTNSNCNVIVVFTNSGDKISAEQRIPEAIQSCRILGVKEDNIIFLGYPNDWNKAKYGHIYQAPDNVVITSSNGYSKTSGTVSHPDYSTKRYGHPLNYSRANILRNIKDVILDYKPELIFCVGFDSHPDHRAASLLVEEAMGIILKEKDDYCPEVYKGFAYNTAWTAESDFYKLNMKSTVKPNQYILNSNYDMDEPQYNWKDRVRYPVLNEVLTHSLFTNIIYKSLISHKSQKPLVVTNASKIINSDKVFWYRSTNSLTYKSKIYATSGNASYLNDFKLFDCSDISNRTSVKYDNCLWTPVSCDLQKEITIKFPHPEDISKVSFYDNFDLKNNILAGTLTFSNGETVKVGALHPNGSRTDISFPLKKQITSLSFKINLFEGSRPGLTEIEVYNNSYKRKIPHLIKLYDKGNDDFMYRYFVHGQSEISLGVYQYPISMDYRLKISEGSDKYAQLVGDKLFLRDGFQFCRLRAELKNNPKIYDEIEIVNLNSLDVLSYKMLSMVERFYFKCYNKLSGSKS